MDEFKIDQKLAYTLSNNDSEDHFVQLDLK